MLLKIACSCGHIGIASAKSLPRNFTCSQCGASRRVEAGERIVSTEARQEWVTRFLAAARAIPPPRRRSA